MSQPSEGVPLPESALSKAVSDLLIDREDAPTPDRAASSTDALSTSPALDEDAAPKKKKGTHHRLKISAAERGLLAMLKSRAAHLSGPVKKSELLRAGIHALSRMGDDALAAVLVEFRDAETQTKKRHRKHD